MMETKAMARILPIVVLLFSVGLAGAQGDEEFASVEIKKVTIPNFIKDPIVLANISSDEDVSATLPSTFIISSPETGQKFFWNPILCRLVAIDNGKFPEFIELVAEGAHPFSISLGTIGRPRFFGMRIVDGFPEFLYTYGQLSVEERFKLSADGKRLLQSFQVKSNSIDGAFSLSKSWREAVTADNGRWNNNVLMLTREELAEGFTVTYHLDPTAPRPTAN